jgi:hypothetical protein
MGSVGRNRAWLKLLRLSKRVLAVCRRRGRRRVDRLGALLRVRKRAVCVYRWRLWDWLVLWLLHVRRRTSVSCHTLRVAVTPLLRWILVGRILMALDGTTHFLGLNRKRIAASGSGRGGRWGRGLSIRGRSRHRPGGRGTDVVKRAGPSLKGGRRRPARVWAWRGARTWTWRRPRCLVRRLRRIGIGDVLLMRRGLGSVVLLVFRRPMGLLRSAGVTVFAVWVLSTGRALGRPRLLLLLGSRWRLGTATPAIIGRVEDRT